MQPVKKCALQYRYSSCRRRFRSRLRAVPGESDKTLQRPVTSTRIFPRAISVFKPLSRRKQRKWSAPATSADISYRQKKVLQIVLAGELVWDYGRCGRVAHNQQSRERGTWSVALPSMPYEAVVVYSPLAIIQCTSRHTHNFPFISLHSCALDFCTAFSASGCRGCQPHRGSWWYVWLSSWGVQDGAQMQQQQQQSQQRQANQQATSSTSGKAAGCTSVGTSRTGRTCINHASFRATACMPPPLASGFPLPAARIVYGTVKPYPDA